MIVDDLDAAKRFLGDALGLQPDGGSDRPDRGLKTAFFRCGDVRIEAIELSDPEARKLRMGSETQARIEHIAIEVDDLTGTLENLEKFGVRTNSTSPMKLGSDLTIWTIPESSDGVMYQFIERNALNSRERQGQK